MTNIILNGRNGKMGSVITELVSHDNDCKIVAGFDINDFIKQDYPVYTDISKCTEKADVIIDFSHPSALDGLLNYALETNTAIIEATTGLSEEQKGKLISASEHIPVFMSANMSLGINLIKKKKKKATMLLGDDFDIEIIEKHHNQKIDAPSGTALAIADEISSVLKNPPQYVYDRHTKRTKRSKNEIGLHAVRGGTIVGEHEVIFAGHNEVITLSHSAQSKEVFAAGAIKAAKFLKGKPRGYYSMTDLVNSID